MTDYKYLTRDEMREVFEATPAPQHEDREAAWAARLATVCSAALNRGTPREMFQPRYRRSIWVDLSESHKDIPLGCLLGEESREVCADWTIHYLKESWFSVMLAACQGVWVHQNCTVSFDLTDAFTIGLTSFRRIGTQLVNTANLEPSTERWLEIGDIRAFIIDENIIRWGVRAVDISDTAASKWTPTADGKVYEVSAPVARTMPYRRGGVTYRLTESGIERIDQPRYREVSRFPVWGTSDEANAYIITGQAVTSRGIQTVSGVLVPSQTGNIREAYRIRFYNKDRERIVCLGLDRTDSRVTLPDGTEIVYDLEHGVAGCLVREAATGGHETAQRELLTTGITMDIHGVPLRYLEKGPWPTHERATREMVRVPYRTEAGETEHLFCQTGDPVSRGLFRFPATTGFNGQPLPETWVTRQDTQSKITVHATQEEAILHTLYDASTPSDTLAIDTIGIDKLREWAAKYTPISEAFRNDDISNIDGREYVWSEDWTTPETPSPWLMAYLNSEESTKIRVPKSKHHLVHKCVICEELVYLPSATNTTVHYQGRTYAGALCQYCMCSQDLFECNECTEWFERSQLSQQNGVCVACFEANWCECDQCGSWHHSSHLRNGLCSDCRGNTRLQAYSYNPTPRFHKASELDKLFFGAEIELEMPNTANEDETAYEAKRIVESPEGRGFLYAKRDGSLNNGAEFVTHPFSFSWFKENKNKIEALFEKMRNAGFEAKRSCGLHIHVSREPHTPVEQFRLLQLVYENPGFWKKASTRQTFDYCHLETPVCSFRERVRVAKGNNQLFSRRYVALNPSPHRTLEWRLWAGTGQFHKFASALAMTAASHDFVRSGATGLKPSIEKLAKFIREHTDFAALAEPRLALAIPA